jgi:4a-hydroxytetrahydrobiopterin dehydratase
MALTQAEITKLAKQLPPSWSVVEKELQCDRKFPDFVTAMNFVNQIVAPAEAAAHHPDIYISYNKVKITLTTHDAGGLTQKDFDLAVIIAALPN